MKEIKLEVIEGGRVKAPAVPSKTDIVSAHGRWTRALKPMGLATLAWELCLSQGALAHAFRDIDIEATHSRSYAAGRASLWKVAA